MFEFIQRADRYDTGHDLSTSHGRFLDRYQVGINLKLPWWRTRLTFWWLVHNIPCHLLIGIFPIKPFFAFHDWTSAKMQPWTYDGWEDPPP